ncbi:hypothetical protein ACIGXM_21710 [Kitasatospora sp. NPDC052896]|uniref:hypothetical protein n=1 Tax=Kitasatospora sp. NPDC052896 TaxID=3364061 RepID=UPI0037C5AC6B
MRVTSPTALPLPLAEASACSASLRLAEAWADTDASKEAAAAEAEAAAAEVDALAAEAREATGAGGEPEKLLGFGEKLLLAAGFAVVWEEPQAVSASIPAAQATAITATPPGRPPGTHSLIRRTPSA